MFETLVITFREGLEAFLIVAIMTAYLVKTGRKNLLPTVYAGISVAVLLSATTGWHVAELAEDPMWEGSLALIAGAMVASFTYLVMKNARNIKRNIHETMTRHAERAGVWSVVGVFVFTVLMIAREGMETALMLGSISAQTNAMNMWIGASAGLFSVAAIGWLWVTQSDRINLKLFMQVTGLFLILFAIDLFIYGVHELSETGVLLGVLGGDLNYALHDMTEIFGHGSLYSQIVTYSLIVVPVAWLCFSSLRSRKAVATS